MSPGGRSFDRQRERLFDEEALVALHDVQDGHPVEDGVQGFVCYDVDHFGLIEVLPFIGLSIELNLTQQLHVKLALFNAGVTVVLVARESDIYKLKLVSRQQPGAVMRHDSNEATKHHGQSQKGVFVGVWLLRRRWEKFFEVKAPGICGFAIFAVVKVLVGRLALGDFVVDAVGVDEVTDKLIVRHQVHKLRVVVEQLPEHVLVVFTTTIGKGTNLGMLEIPDVLPGARVLYLYIVAIGILLNFVHGTAIGIVHPVAIRSKHLRLISVILQQVCPVIQPIITLLIQVKIILALKECLEDLILRVRILIIQPPGELPRRCKDHVDFCPVVAARLVDYLVVRREVD